MEKMRGARRERRGFRGMGETGVKRCAWVGPDSVSDIAGIKNV